MRNRRLVLFDAVSTVAWFLMDAAWLMERPKLSVICAVPTLVACLLVAWYDERRPSLILADLAVFAWAGMNLGWMLNDTGLWSDGKPLSRVMLLVGALLLLAAILTARQSAEVILAILRRFRRFRIGRT